jgi:lipopolysaccharide biosynthesis glycosyltransferase
MKSIPVVHCFDNNYVLPAAVAFHSMLSHGNKIFFYELFVLHENITEKNQVDLKNLVGLFKNASLNFIEIKNSEFERMFIKTKNKGHFSKEIYFKFITPTLFPKFEKIIIADVDVVYCGDISEIFDSLSSNERYYVAGHRPFIKRNSQIFDDVKAAYLKKFTQAEYAKVFYISAGLMIFNLNLMRTDGLQKKFIEFAQKNVHRLILPEQDVINYVSYPNIKALPANSLLCSYVYDIYKNEYDFENDELYSASDVRGACLNPIQLHFASKYKPWTYPTTTKSEIWFRALADTPFLKRYLDSMGALLNEARRNKKILEIKLPFGEKSLVISRKK